MAVRSDWALRRAACSMALASARAASCVDWAAAMEAFVDSSSVSREESWDWRVVMSSTCEVVDSCAALSCGKC